MRFDSKPDYFVDEPDEPESRSYDSAEGDDDRGDRHDREERRGRPRAATPWRLVVFVICAILGGMSYVWYFSPYEQDVKAVGVVTELSRRGSLMTTTEGILSLDRGADMIDPTAGRYLRFSLDNDSLAALLSDVERAATPVRVTYKSYYGTLPWRGEAHSIITAVEPWHPSN